MKDPTRRQVLGASAGLALAAPARGASDEMIETHGLSAFGDLKYRPDFTHFDYVNPNAPIGGLFSHLPGTSQFNQNFLTFNSFNGYILRGDAALQIETNFATLMTRAHDEPDAVYAYAARAVRHDPDRRVFQFLLRPGITFHDGSPITAADVAWSIETLKADGHPLIAQALADIERVTVDATDALTVHFGAARSREAPLLLAELVPILSRAYYSRRAFSETSMEPPIGSGPFRVGRFEQGRYVEYERVANWWGWQVPSIKGQMNWARLRVDYYRDRSVALEAFKAGEYLFREEFTSRDWATAYDFPALREGRVKRDEVPDERPSGAQGFFLNMRRPQFKDPRIREAVGLCFDFEWSNKNLFFGFYTRTASFFENSDMKAQGRPSPAELALLEPLRGKVPEAVFGEAVVPPISDGTGADRNNLRRAAQLLREAGVTVQGGQARLAGGERLGMEFMIDQPTTERITLPYVENLRRIGVDATVRRVDPAQYQSRIKDFDFDVVQQRYSMSLSPGEGLRRMFSSADADRPGSYNLSGIRDSAVDALIEAAIRAQTRGELNTACRALDRVLRALRPWVAQWYKPSHWLAHWDIYERPAIKPRYLLGAFQTWWVDPAKARRLGRGL